MNNTDDEIIDEKIFGLRLAKLRQSVDVSAREMSLALGQNKNYINSIETGKTFAYVLFSVHMQIFKYKS